jgi:hypothetical protein
MIRRRVCVVCEDAHILMPHMRAPVNMCSMADGTLDLKDFKDLRLRLGLISIGSFAQQCLHH